MFGPGDVGVEQADRGARLGERDGQVDADRALADAALARRDGDDVLDARDELLGLARLRAADHRAPGDVDLGRADRAERGARALRSISSLSGQAGVVSSIVKRRPSPSMTTSLTMSRVTMSRPSSGSWTVRSASMTASR